VQLLPRLTHCFNEGIDMNNEKFRERFSQEFGPGSVFEHGFYVMTRDDQMAPTVAFELDESERFEFSIQGVDDIPVADPSIHFDSFAVLSISGGDEIVLIEEPGRWLGCVFYNSHEEGLFSLDCLDDEWEEECEWSGAEVSWDEYQALSRTERIQSMPFFQDGLLAKTPEEFFSRLKRP
jgi:hypothetical protein